MSCPTTALFTAASCLAGDPAMAQGLDFGASIGLEVLSYRSLAEDPVRLLLGLTLNGEIVPGLDLSLGIDAWSDVARGQSGIDLQDAALTYTRDDFQALLGYEIESWSVTEASELTNIVNQIDLERDITGNTRMGQPMLRLSYLSDFGWFGLYYFPLSPERRFDPVFGLNGIDAIYDTGRQDREPGYALRYRHTLGAVEVGAFGYRGLDKSPVPVVENGIPRLFYPEVTQHGLSLQALLGDTYLRSEVLAISGRPDRTGTIRDSLSYGFEIEDQTYGVFGMDADLSLLAAYTRNSLGRSSTELLQDDLSLGAKLNWNNVGSTELSLLLTHDLTFGSTFASLGFEARLRDNLKLELDVVEYFDVHADDILAPLQDAGHARLELTLFF